MEINHLQTDVLIVGGGLAGTNAAMGAAENGASVVVADKGNINRSGDIGGGVDHFLAYLNEGREWDTQDAFLGYVENIGRGTGHLSIIESVYCAELPDAIEILGKPLGSSIVLFPIVNPMAFGEVVIDLSFRLSLPSRRVNDREGKKTDEEEQSERYEHVIHIQT